MAAVTPDYAPAARRLIVDNNWYSTLLRDNVDLVTSSISHLTHDGIVTTDGVEHPTDLIIAAIGFEVTKYLWPTEYVGRSGRRLEDLDRGRKQRPACLPQSDRSGLFQQVHLLRPELSAPLRLANLVGGDLGQSTLHRPRWP